MAYCVFKEVYHVAFDYKKTNILFDYGEIRKMINEKKFTQDTLVWKPGLPEWKPANKISELRLLFEASPSLPDSLLDTDELELENE
jgi:hypothetical protein